MITLREKSCRQPAARRKQSYIEQEVKKVNRKIKKLLTNQGGNYIFPFFWQHGEEEMCIRDRERQTMEIAASSRFLNRRITCSVWLCCL